VSDKASQNTTVEGKQWLTKALFRIAPALSFRVNFALRAVLKQTVRFRAAVHSAAKPAHHEWVVEVSNLIEKVDLILARKQCGANTVHWRVAPTLLKEERRSRSVQSLRPGALPRSKIHPSRPKTPQTWNRLHLSRSRGRQSQSCSRLTRTKSVRFSGKMG